MRSRRGRHRGGRAPDRRQQPHAARQLLAVRGDVPAAQPPDPGGRLPPAVRRPPPRHVGGAGGREHGAGPAARPRARSPVLPGPASPPTTPSWPARTCRRAERRRVSNRHFRDALDHVPYVIGGPRKPARRPELHPRLQPHGLRRGLGAAERVPVQPGLPLHQQRPAGAELRRRDSASPRTNAATEFWRADYYDRLGHIPVTTPESGWIDETPEEKAARKQQFFDDCAARARQAGSRSASRRRARSPRRTASPSARPGPLQGRCVPDERASAEQTRASCRSRWRTSTSPRTVRCSRASSSHRSAWRNGASTSSDRDRDGAVPRGLPSRVPHVRRGGDRAGRGRRPAGRRPGRRRHEPRHPSTSSTRSSSTTSGHWSCGRRRRARTPARPSSTARRPSACGRASATTSACRGRVNLAFGGSTLEACRRYFERLVLPHRPRPARPVRRRQRHRSRRVGPGGRRALPTVRRHRPDPLPDDAVLVRVDQAQPGPRGVHRHRSARPTPASRPSSSSTTSGATSTGSSTCSVPTAAPTGELFEPDELHVNADAHEILGRLLRQELTADA